jgi:hypothetical protein
MPYDENEVRYPLGISGGNPEELQLSDASSSFDEYVEESAAGGGNIEGNTAAVEYRYLKWSGGTGDTFLLLYQGGIGLAGALTSSGSLIRGTGKALAGALTSSGAVTKLSTFARSIAGALTFSGAPIKGTGRMLAGALTSSGAVTKLSAFARSLTGAFTPSGAVTKLSTFARSLAGALTLAGTLTKEWKRILAGALTLSGAVTNLSKFARSLAGVVTFSGALTKLSTFARSIAGALTFSGALIRGTGKMVAGALTSSGAMQRASAKILSGELFSVRGTDNLITNYGMETNTTGWGLAVSAGSAATFTRDTTTFYNGVAGGKVDITADDGDTDWHINIYYPVTITEPGTYTLTGWVKASTNKTIPFSCQQNASPYTWFGGKSVAVTTSWQRFTFSCNVYAVDKQVRWQAFLGKLSTGWQFYFDDVELKKTSGNLQKDTGKKAYGFMGEQGEVNQVYNGDFERAGLGGADVFWSWGESLSGDSTITRDTTIFHGGASSVKLTYGTSGWSFVNIPMTLHNGATYQLSFWCRGDGTRAGRYYVYSSADASYPINNTSTGNTTTDWVQVTTTFVVPANSTLVYFYCRDPGAAGSAWFDDVEITKITDQGTELLGNPGFEVLGAGGTDVFSVWLETIASGSIEAEGTIIHGGSKAAKLTCAVAYQPAMYQNFGTIPGARYYFEVWGQDDGTTANYFGIYDRYMGQGIKTFSGAGSQFGTSYAKKTWYFNAVSTLTSIYFYAPPTVGKVLYVDDVSVTLVSVPLSGSTIKDTGKNLLAGALTMSGALTKLSTFGRAVAGTITFLGITTKDIILGGAHIFEAALTFNGAVTKSTVLGANHYFTGALTFAGSTIKDWARSLVGAITFSGTRPNWAISIIREGALTFTSTIAWALERLLEGTLTFTGSLIRDFGPSLSGVLSLYGGIIKDIGKLLSGVLTFTGAASGIFSEILYGKLFGRPNPSGNIKSSRRK